MQFIMMRKVAGRRKAGRRDGHGCGTDESCWDCECCPTVSLASDKEKYAKSLVLFGETL